MRQSLWQQCRPQHWSPLHLNLSVLVRILHHVHLGEPQHDMSLLSCNLFHTPFSVGHPWDVSKFFKHMQLVNRRTTEYSPVCYNKGALYTMPEGLWPLKSKISHWQKYRDHPLHFTLELEGLRAQGSLITWTNLHGFLHVMKYIMFHGLPDFVSSSPEWRVQNQTRRQWHFKISQPLVHYNWLCRRSHMKRMVTNSIWSRAWLRTSYATLESPWPHKIQSQLS